MASKSSYNQPFEGDAIQRVALDGAPQPERNAMLAPMINMIRKCMSCTLIALIALLCSMSPATAADTEEARAMQAKYIHLMHDKNYAEALRLILARRAVRDGWAIGYFDDWFRADIPKEARDLIEDWLGNGSKAGNAEAQRIMAIKYLKGDYLTGDYAKPGTREEHIVHGVTLLEKAADQGDGYARFVLSQMSKKGLSDLGITSKYAEQE